MKRSTAIGDRGKWAESQVVTILDDLNDRLAVTYHRYPDARSARGGGIAAQPADYLVAAYGKSFHLEVKETEHDYRLKRDKIKQLPKLHKFEKCGMDFVAVVYHSQIERWRCVPSNHLPMGETSWDLRDLPTFETAHEAVMATGWF